VGHLSAKGRSVEQAEPLYAQGERTRVGTRSATARATAAQRLPQEQERGAPRRALPAKRRTPIARKRSFRATQKSFCSFIAAPMSPLTFSFPVM
jgi:hypothetical protein